MRGLSLWFLIPALAAASCGSNESSGPSNSGGSGGGDAAVEGGSAGSSGSSAGNAGSAGSSGNAGSSGSAGGAGSSGSAGTAGSAGSAGSSGAAGAGGSSIVDANTLQQKLMFGYQGWFLCPQDGSPPNRWVHWFKSQTPSADQLNVDMWPDTTELGPDELFDTQMTYANGQPAKLYSAYQEKTVVRHFQWMADAGIDGVFLQRFLSELKDPAFFDVRNHITENVRMGAETHGRTFALMYDISGASADTLVEDLKQDWAHLIDTLKVTQSDRYLRHKGKPLLAIWGLGFADRPATAQQAAEIVAWFKNEAPASQQVTLMGGVPTHWRTLDNDAQTDPAWAGVYASFDVLSPWAVGRYGDDAGADNFRDSQLVPDLAFATAAGIDYLPVVFPGFSWKNLNGGPLNQIPRNGGAFWWRQVYNAISAGSTMVYGAMFDEVDEGTAMFKLAPTAAYAPAQGSFVNLDADGQQLPSDWYLRLAGAGGEMLRGEIALSPVIPISP